jgi:hypothetical protein
MALLHIEHQPTGSGLVSGCSGKDGDCVNLAIGSHGSELESQTPSVRGKTGTPNLVLADGRGQECMFFEGIEPRDVGRPLAIVPPRPIGLRPLQADSRGATISFVKLRGSS